MPTEAEQLVALEFSVEQWRKIWVMLDYAASECPGPLDDGETEILATIQKVWDRSNRS
jgi:hypothetical protein